jgi:hypothetical protein
MCAVPLSCVCPCPTFSDVLPRSFCWHDDDFDPKPETLNQIFALLLLAAGSTRHTSLCTHMHLFRSFSWLYQVSLDTSGAQASGAHVYMEIHKASHLSPSPTSPPAEAQDKSRYVCVSFSVSVGLPAWSSTSIRVLGLYVQTHARAHTRKHTQWKPSDPSFH